MLLSSGSINRLCEYNYAVLAASSLCRFLGRQVTIINFTVTMTGLEDQLLVDVVKNERPDLEAKKDELVSTVGRKLHCMYNRCVATAMRSSSLISLEPAWL